MKKIFFVINISSLFFLMIFASCAQKPSCSPKSFEMATLWFQRSAEAKALQIQAYNIATTVLSNLSTKSKKKDKKPKAVVLDIDETVLDNGPYQASNVLAKRCYPENWNTWVLNAQAKAIPGSLEFIKTAKAKGFHVLYISNRAHENLELTYQNLKQLGVQLSRGDLFLKDESSDKEKRRKSVLEKYEIVMMVGDNLADFSNMFYHKSMDERDRQVQIFRKEFGTRFILLPNPMYGDWEGAIYDYDYSKDYKQKEEDRTGAFQYF